MNRIVVIYYPIIALLLALGIYIHYAHDQQQYMNYVRHSNQLESQLTEKEALMQTYKNENDELKMKLKKFQKTVYLTFDDGPSLNTLKILKTLKKEKIPGTFFINGHINEETIPILEKIKKDGHSIGNHTDTHQYSSIYSSPRAFIKDFKTLEDKLREDMGITTNLYRFPGGSNSHRAISEAVHKQLNNEGYVFFDWNVDSGDSHSGNPSKEYLIQNTLSQMKGKQNAIILFHDTAAKVNTTKALPEIIKALKKDGYEFDVLSEDSFNRQFILDK